MQTSATAKALAPQAAELERLVTVQSSLQQDLHLAATAKISLAAQVATLQANAHYQGLKQAQERSATEQRASAAEAAASELRAALDAATEKLREAAAGGVEGGSLGAVLMSEVAAADARVLSQQQGRGTAMEEQACIEVRMRMCLPVTGH